MKVSEKQLSDCESRRVDMFSPVSNVSQMLPIQLICNLRCVLVFCKPFCQFNCIIYILNSNQQTVRIMFCLLNFINNYTVKQNPVKTNSVPSILQTILLMLKSNLMQ